MKTKTLVLTILTISVFLVGIAEAGYYFVWMPTVNTAVNKAIAEAVPEELLWQFPASATKLPSTGSVSGGNLAYSALPDPGGIPSGLPLRLQIPVIGVDSAIEDALITPDGRMDVPAGTVDVAWFALGPQPGQIGSAVIGGHYGIQNGVPFVFYDLSKMKIGDSVYIVNDEGQTFTFVVRRIASFGLNADATTVFTSTDGLAHLNLITCQGIWNAVDGNYPDRLVVFTDLVSSSGTVPVGATSPAPATGASGSASTATNAGNTFSQSLGIGSSGASVVTLQTFLEQRGLLELPAGTTNGYFGALTSAAVARYQTSVGISPAGVLGPLTRAYLNAQLASNTGLPNTGENSTSPVPVSAQIATQTQGSILNSPGLFQNFIHALQSSYETPLDGLITSLLLVAILCAIGYIIFEIVRPRHRK